MCWGREGGTLILCFMGKAQACCLGGKEEQDVEGVVTPKGVIPVKEWRSRRETATAGGEGVSVHPKRMMSPT